MAYAMKTIKNDLIEQLEERGIHQSHYMDMVNDYISFFKIKKLLIKDIDDRGVTVRYDNGGGQFGYKKNDSVAELTKVNTQMLKILSELGLKAADIEADDDDDNEEM